MMHRADICEACEWGHGKWGDTGEAALTCGLVLHRMSPCSRLLAGMLQSGTAKCPHEVDEAASRWNAAPLAPTPMRPPPPVREPTEAVPPAPRHRMTGRYCPGFRIGR